MSQNRMVVIAAAVISVLVVALFAAGRIIDTGGSRAGADFDEPQWVRPVAGSPYSIAANDELTIVVAHVVTALDPDDGAVVWESDLPGAWLHRPALSDDTVLVSADDRFVALEPTSGAVRWTIDGPAAGPVALATVDDGTEVALLASEDGSVAAHDADTGRRLWAASHAGEIWGPPATDGGLGALAWSDFDEPMMRVFDLETGMVEWQVAVDPYVAPPVIADGMVFVAEGDGNFSGRATAYTVADGSEIWSVPLPASFQTGTQPAVDGGQLAVVDRLGTVTLLDTSSGAIVWQISLRRPVLHTRVFLTPDAVVLTDEPGEVVLLDRADGSIRERVRPDGFPVGVAVAGDRLLVALRLTEPGRVEAWPRP